MSFTLAFDVTAANIRFAPKGVQLAGYDTGPIGDIAWLASSWQANPGAIHIAQSPLLSADEGPFSDILDVETGAATMADVGPWSIAMLAAFREGKRPGQRTPVVYMSASNVSAVVNELVRAGIKSGIGLWVANWNLSEAQAIADVLNAAGPFPVIGVQFKMDGPYDSDIFSTAWVQTVSKAPAPVPPVPPSTSNASFTVAGLLLDASWPQYHPMPDHYTLEYGGIKVLSIPAGVNPEAEFHLAKFLIPDAPGKVLDLYAIVDGTPHLVKSEKL